MRNIHARVDKGELIALCSSANGSYHRWTGYKLVHLISLPSEAVRIIWLPSETVR